VRERRVSELGGARRQLVDPAVGEGAEVLDRPLQRGEGGAAGLVRERHGYLGPARQGVQEAPFRAGQVLESVREDRAAVPRAEVGP
jgi:hypothetical protein